MDYILEHAKEIMMLCFGIGFFILALVATRTLLVVTRLMRKADDVSDLAIYYINKPLSMIVKAEKSLNKFLDSLGKK